MSDRREEEKRREKRKEEVRKKMKDVSVIIINRTMIKENQNNFAVEHADVFEEQRYTCPYSSTQEVSIGLSSVKNGFPLTVGYIRIETNVVKMISSFYQREGYGSKLLKYAENKILRLDQILWGSM